MRPRVIVEVWESSKRCELVAHLQNYLGDCIDFVESANRDQTKELQKESTELVLQYPGKDFNAAVICREFDLM